MDTEIAQLLKLRREVDERIAEIQASCDHRQANRVPNGSTGHYDPSFDRYWYNCHCPRCDKRWVEDQ